MFEKSIRCFAGDPGDLVNVIDVRMETDLLGHVATLVGQFDEGIGPWVRFICYAARGHSKSLRCETDTLNVRNAEQPAECQDDGCHFDKKTHLSPISLRSSGCK